MLAANLPVCQYAGMPGKSNSNNGGSNNTNTTSSGNSSNTNNNSSSINTCNTGSGSGSNSNTNNNNVGNLGSSSSNSIIGSSVGLVGGGTSAVAAKNQLEQLNTMREALFSQDGWGCQHVNQDTNWEVPSSPEPTNKDPGAQPLWKPTINNGTDLWESNLRNGGQPPTQPVQKTPWGHTPSSNLGGTWGEDDDGQDSSNVWTGSSNNPAAASGNVGVASVGASGVSGVGPNTGHTPQWGQSSVGVGGVGTGGGNATGPATGNLTGVAPGGASNSVGVNVASNTGAGPSGGTAGNGWGDPRELRSGGGGPMVGGGGGGGVPIDMRNVDPRDAMRAASAGDPRDLRMLDPRDPIRGDPRGISGRLNGTSEMWGQHHPIAHNQMPAMNKMIGPGGVGGNVTSAVVGGGGVGGGGGVPGIGPGVGVGINAGGVGVGGNVVGAQWGAAQTVVGPKDITSMTGGVGGGKQSTGWEEPSPPPQRRNIPNYDDGTSLWGGQQSRVPGGGGGGGSHWKDISDPMNRNHLIRNTIGNQNVPNVGVGGVVGGLGVSTGSGLGNTQTGGVIGVPGNPNNQMSGVGPQGRLPSTVVPGVGVGQHKPPDNAMWVHPNSSAGNRNPNASWGDDGNHNVGGATSSNWVDDKSNASIGQIGANVVVGGVNSWNDAPGAWNKNPNKMSGGGAGGWGAAGVGGVGNNDGNDLNSDWGTHSGIVSKSQQQQQQKLGVSGLNIEMIKQSKQYRILVDTGFKKDDVERALISANMNIEEAAEMLRANATIVMDSWRQRHDETISSYADHTNSTGGGVGGGFSGRYPAASTQPTMSFPPNNLLNNMSGNSVVGAGGNNPNLAALNAMQPLQVQKYLNQGPHNLSAGPQSVNAAAVSFGQGSNVTAAVNAASNSSNQPSAQQLRMLVQQIQLAVHSGYLSSQILNQPLAPATLLLLNQLLSNIKHLQGAQQSLARGNNSNNLQINVAIAKYKQQIQNLQNQINAQQAMYIKQQQQQQQQTLQQNPQQHPAAHVSNSNTEYLRGQHDAISALQGNFSEINLNKQSSGYQSAPNQQSRLNQWKLPVLEKDLTSDNTDFSRAPGATKQGLSTTNANNMGPLGLQSDGTWSTGRNIGDGWPDPSNDNENKDWSVAQPTTATTYTDLVQEFEPGKPWKGSQIKSIEDDPSITPGSVARSPLSINPTPKEADIFANASKNSPTDLPPLSLSSSTWSFNPSSSNQNFPSWSDNTQQCPTSELWANPINKTSRGPPPGLGANKSGGGVQVASVNNSSSVVSGSSNGWLVGGGVNRGVPCTNAGWAGTNSSWNSNWLLLKNLTSQIDSSTLRTLCMQHGPLINFHLYLNQGIALCKYATREEANKAQMTLNNCVLGNTTICAESPSENEVQNILQHLPQTSNTAGAPSCSSINGGGSNGGGNGGGGGGSAGGGGNITTNGSNGGGGGSNGANNGSVAGGGNSVVNSGGGVGSGNSGNNAPNSSSVACNAQGQQSSGGGGVAGGACNSNGGSNNAGGGNNGPVGGGGGNNVPAGVGGSNNAAAQWRQTQNQQQQQQNQSRPREADYDYISKFVCSIVDD